MSDIKLFSITDEVVELNASSVSLEKELQKLIEENMYVFFGVTFLASEFSTSNGGRIDSLGIDENGCPVIFEYKRSTNENVINQGLFYLDWLLDHKAEFELLIMKRHIKDQILDWSMPRLICIASDFTKYDEYAVKQINRNIDLIRYKKFGDKLILFELINSNTTTPLKQVIDSSNQKSYQEKTFEEQYRSADKGVRELYDSIKDYILSLGDDVSENQLKLYTAFKKIKNIVCAEIRSKNIFLYLKIDPETVEEEQGFLRDVRKIGHWGTGDTEITIKNAVDFNKAKKYIDMAYENN